MQSNLRGFLALAAGLALSLQASASDVPEKSLAEVLSESRAVVHGRVVDQFSQWEEYGEHKIIFTYSTLRVEHGQFRQLPETSEVVVRTVGGSVEGYTQLLIDEASFTLGEEVIVFLGLEEDWLHLSVSNFRQGKYTVVRGADGRIRGVRQDAGQQTDPAKLDERPLIPLSRFAADLRRARRGLAEGETSDVHPLTPVR